MGLFFFSHNVCCANGSEADPTSGDEEEGASASLDGLTWMLPYVSPGAPGYMTTLPNATVTATMGGTLGQLYLVGLRFRGVVEQKSYSGGANDGAFFQIEGTPAADASNLYRLKVSYPGDADATYYLNRGTSGLSVCWLIDYAKQIAIKGGSTVELYADAIDTFETWNTSIGPADPPGTPAWPFTVEGVTTVSQPYNGQFIEMTVESVYRLGGGETLTTEDDEPLTTEDGAHNLVTE